MNDFMNATSTLLRSPSMTGGINGEQGVLLSQATTFSPAETTIIPPIELPIPQMIQFHHHNHNSNNNNNKQNPLILVSSVLNTSAGGGGSSQVTNKLPSLLQAQDSSLKKKPFTALTNNNNINKININRFGRQAYNENDNNNNNNVERILIKTSTPDILVELIGYWHAKYALQYLIFYLLSSSIVILICLRLFRQCRAKDKQKDYSDYKKLSANNNQNKTSGASFSNCQSNYGFYYTTRLGRL